MNRAGLLPDRVAVKKELLRTAFATHQYELGTNPNIDAAANNTLRGSKTIRASVDFERLGRKWSHNSVDHGVLRFNIGDTHSSSEIITPPSVKAALAAFLDNEVMPYDKTRRHAGMAYTESQGDYGLRTAIAKSYGVRPEDVFFTEGVTGALFFLGLVFAFAYHDSNTVNPTRNRFLFPKPVYPPWVGISKLFGMNVTTVGRYREGQNIGDLDLRGLDLEASLAHRCFILTSADNPIGRFLKEETVRYVAATIQEQMLRCRQVAYLVIDDIYRDLIPPEQRIDYFRIAREFGIPLIYLNGTDKVIGTGLHGGYMIPFFPEPVQSIRDKFLSKLGTIFAMYLGTNRLTQVAAMPYFVEYDLVMQEVAANLEVFRTRSDCFVRELQATDGPLTYRYGTPQLPYYHSLAIGRGVDSEAFTYALLDRHGICVAPGSSFEEPDVFRVAMMRNPVDPVNVARIMQEFTAHYLNR